MNRQDVLSFEWRCGACPHLHVAEFVIGGRTLLEHCERATGQAFGVISPFGWTSSAYQVELAERLLLRRPAVLPTGRRELLVCSLCADLGCGCISADVSLERGYFIWDEFGFESREDPASLSIFPMGKFVFPEEQMIKRITGLVHRVDPTTAAARGGARPLPK